MVHKSFLSWIAVVTWMAIIFFFSHQPAVESSEISTGISRFILQVVELLPMPIHIDQPSFHVFVRKSAHFFVYFMLGLLLVNAFRVSHVEKKRACFLSIGLSVIYAISDEFHQLFVPGRSGQLSDILIDSSGAIVGIIFYLFLLKVIKK